ncbi:unnamed protein product [Sympodiomycopsis kandeliae]
MADRPAPPRPSLSQQLLRSFRPKAIAPLASSATASPAHGPVDHKIADPHKQPGASIAIPTNRPIPLNPFEVPSSPPSPVHLPTPLLQPVIEGSTSIQAAPTPAEDLRSHLVEFAKPLPLSEPTRTETIKQRCKRLYTISRLTRTANPPPPQGQVLQLVVAILGSKDDDHYPPPIREAACRLLTDAIEHSDERGKNALKAVIETRSGAPGSQSSKSLDSDQPLANIDRAVFYAMVVEERQHDYANRSSVPSKDDLSSTALPHLHAKLRALEALSKGGKEVVAFEGIVELLDKWLVIVWKEVQIVRQLAPLVQLPRSLDDDEEEDGSGDSAHPLDPSVYAQELSSREWSLQAILHLLTSIVTFNFARVNQVHIQHAIKTTARLFIDPIGHHSHLPQKDASSGTTTTSSPHWRALAAARKDPIGTTGDAAPASSSSQSRERRHAAPLMEGYSYYGTESVTPESTQSSATSPATTPLFGPKTTVPSHPVNASSLTSSLAGGVASRAPSRLSSLAFSEDADADEPATLPVHPDLDDLEVRAVIRLLDATFKFGYMPSCCVPDLAKMLCRVMGYETIEWTVSLPDGLKQLAQNDAMPRDTAWLGLVRNFLSQTLLRSHSANSSIQVVRSLLALPSTAEGSEKERMDADAPQVEDEAVLVGALSFLRLALHSMGEEATTNSSQNVTGPNASTSAIKEDALLARFSVALLLPALRGALHRESDILDLQVMALVGDVLIPSKARGSNKEHRAGNLPLGNVRIEEWDHLLQLTMLAQRHVLSWHAGLATSHRVKTPLLLTTLINLVAQLPLASPDQIASSATVSHPTVEGAPAQATAEKDRGSLLPWTPRLCALLMTLSPALPEKLAEDLVTYHISHHLCLPCTPEWINNLKRLLESFFSSPSAAFASDKTRSLVSDLIFHKVYDSVVSFPEHRSTLIREVILPMAKSFLLRENDTTSVDRARKVLVQAAALSSASAAGVEGQGEDIFNQVRSLLVNSARSERSHPDANDGPRRESASQHHVHFADSGGQHGRKLSQSHLAESSEGSNVPAEEASLEEARQVRSALDLISIFNLIAFSSPWVDFESADELRAGQEKKARQGCIAIFRDLLGLIQPQSVPDTAAKEVPSPNNSNVSARTRLVILQWFLRIRTDLHHRVYLIDDMDDLIAPSAAIILKTPEARAAAAVAEANAASNEKARQARTDAREGGRRGAIGDALGNRSKSRAREQSRERETDRGRAPERSNDSRVRGDRSTSAARASTSLPNKKPANEHESLWQIPQTLAFEMPPTMLRSDILYTYIHADDPSCPHPHTHAEIKQKLPLPVSALMETYLKIIAHEREWELVSYLICHLPPQLANKHLFCGPKAQVQIIALRQYLCTSILQQKLMAEVSLPDSIKRSDVYAVIYSTLTTLLSYRALFTRANQDEMVEAFIAGLNKSQNTAQPCVRALSVAVYEAQKSVTRLLPTMLVKLSTIMSSMTMSVHILELIASIGQIPACYANFTEAEYRRVFGIALQYIQYHQSPAASAREDFRSSPASFTLSQYVMMLAYWNISLWFLTLRISDRPKHVQSITRGLLLANEGRETLADQSEVCFDFLARFTHSNADPKPKRSFMNSVIMGPNSANAARMANGKDANRVSKTWLIGKGLMTISALRKEGWVEVVVRRASGTTALLCKLENAPVSVLPDEDGERIDLPAALMMRRDPEMVGKPVLRAPSGGVYSGRQEPEASDETNDGAAKSLKAEAEDLLKAGDRLRARGPLGPAHFGLASRSRSASFSGPVSNGIVVRSSREDGPYNAPNGGANMVKADGPAATAKVDGETVPPVDEQLRLKAGEETIAKVMQDILNEGSKMQDNGPKPAQVSTAIGTDEKSGQPNGAATAGNNKPAFQPPPKQSVDRDAAVDPSTIALQISAYPDFPNQPMTLLPDEPATTRLIKAIDLTPVVDLHKIGCLYVGPGQKTETEILGNLHGSPAFAQFLSGLGDLITLKNQEDLYTGGLDRETDLHGKYAYAWSDDISQIVFHTATMMPNRAEDANHAFKKALIGNDWVHIVFNESGDEYVFGTLPSQFNYVNIVISPTTKGGTALGSIGRNDTIFYRVSLQRRDGLPQFSPIGDGQLVSYEALPVFVRSLALNANVLSQIYNDTGESMQPYSSNWCSRLNHVVRYRNQLEAKRKKKEQEAIQANPAYIPGAEAEADPRDFTSYA